MEVGEGVGFVVKFVLPVPRVTITSLLPMCGMLSLAAHSGARVAGFHHAKGGSLTTASFIGSKVEADFIKVAVHSAVAIKFYLQQLCRRLVLSNS